MLALNKGKHIVAEIEGVRCTIIESGATEERAKFLKELLESNNFVIKVQHVTKEDEPGSFTIGITSLTFNPVIAVYERNLKTTDGHVVSPAYWNQETTFCDPRYWLLRKGK